MVIITSVDSVLRELARLEDHPSLPDPIIADQIRNLHLEFKFLKMFFWCFEKWDDAADNARLGPRVTNIGYQLRKAGQGLYAAGLTAMQRGQPEKWDILASNLRQTIEHFKPEIAKICLGLLHRSFKCNFSTSHEIFDSISTILENLNHLDRSRSIPTCLLITRLEETLRFLRGFVDFAATWAIMYEKLDDFWNHLQSSANKVACVSFLLWVREIGGPKIDSILPDLQQKIESFTPEVIESFTTEVIEMYLGILKASKTLRIGRAMEENYPTVREGLNKLPPSTSSVVAIAITGGQKSKYLVDWALENFTSQEDISFKLLHVFRTITFVRTPLGLIPIRCVQDDVAAAFRKEVERETSEKILPYQAIFIRRKLQVEVVQIESDDVAEAIAEMVSKWHITKLVIGDSSDGKFPRRQNLSARISECTPSFCTVYAVSKGKLSSVRPADPEANRQIRDDKNDTISSLNSSLSRSSFSSQSGEIVASLVDFLLKDLQVSMKDYIGALGEGLIFLITFLMDPPELSKMGSSIGTEVDDILTDIASFICFFHVDQTREQQSRFPHELFQRIDKVKAEIKRLYVQISNSSLFDFPKTNGLGFIEFLVRKIEEVLNCDAGINACAKYQILAMHKELFSLRSFLEPQNGDNESKDISEQIINVAYRAEHAIGTSLIMDSPIWYCMIQLSDVTEQMKLINLNFEEMKLIKKMKVLKFIDPNLEKMKVRHTNTPALIDEIDKMKSGVGLPEISRIDVVGFEDDADRIIDQLTGGSDQLEIVSVVGMAGIGKTTLATKVFDSPRIQHHFDTRLWCHVSQAHNHRKSLLNILSSSPVHGKLTSEVSDEEEEELAGELWKYLIGRRFLIVLDDIWDIEAWNELKVSFPDCAKRSRILFTSRINMVASGGNHFKDPYFLQPLSDKESWKLLKVQLFTVDVCPPELLEVGQQIARNCKGLPLAVVLISRVLARKGNDLQFWQQVAQSPISHIASEGCMDVLEPSYEHLPDVLKSCFLYFAIFQQGTVIKVKKLIQLWIAEGIILQENERNSLELEDVGYGRLMDLISRNLVIVDDRSFNGRRIKKCRLHDLFHLFCVSKCEQEGFLQLLNTNHLSQNGMECKQYRLCIHAEWRAFIDSKPTGPNVHSLLVHPINSYKKHHHASAFFGGFKLLQVLDLEVLHSGVLFPEEITSLVYLRFLAITGDFTSIPPSIYKLTSLETLRVRSYGSIIFLPSTICKMKRLRHVDIPFGAAVSWDDYDLEKPIGSLNNVVTFSSLYVSSREDAEMLLRMFRKVRRLRFQFYNQFPALYFLDDLESLKVHKVGRAPCSYSFKFPSMIRELILSNLGLPWDEMSVIAKLPNLETLKLLSRSFTGLCWDLKCDEFLGLKFLKLEGLDIKKWNAQGGALPSLQRLLVKDCANLEEIPGCFEEICALEILEVHGCSFSVARLAGKKLKRSLKIKVPPLFVAPCLVVPPPPLVPPPLLKVPTPMVPPHLVVPRPPVAPPLWSSLVPPPILRVPHLMVPPLLVVPPATVVPPLWSSLVPPLILKVPPPMVPPPLWSSLRNLRFPL